MTSFHSLVAQGIPQELPPFPPELGDISHAPARVLVLDEAGKKLAVANALRYFPPHLHETLAPEFAKELETYGRIYAKRFRPDGYEMYARHIDASPARSKQAAAIMMMIHNNLDPAVAQHPHELITYGGNGSVFQNWGQYLLTMQYLSQMTDEQTLVLYSGHPMGLFPSHPDAPRVVITNGMVLSDFGSVDDYERLASLGATMYGQMTAGSFMYIGPQGIVHGTTITILNAGRLYLGLNPEDDLRGKCFLSSGLGGMSGAQAKAAVIAGAVGVIAEVNEKAIAKRHAQGWVQEIETDLDALLLRVEKAKRQREPLSIAYHGNIVDLWEFLVQKDMPIELGSDQTSLHNPWSGGYYPTGISFDDANQMLKADPELFKKEVQSSLRRHYAAVDTLAKRGMYFWDYGNSFLVQAHAAGAEGVVKEDGRFSYTSYVEDIMGPFYFDYGFGPFRWVVCSNTEEDLEVSDKIAADVLRSHLDTAPEDIRAQIVDNLRWIEQAGANKMTVGSKARILYADAQGRIDIARAFNDAIREGRLSAPVVLGRDHHDVSGTDSPYRETANIYDGSQHCADMAIQNVIGDALRGATWVSIHNGGGVGWGKAMNGGFGLLLDGTPEAERRLEMMLHWDVNNGIARRAWARNPSALSAIERAMEKEPRLRFTMPQPVEDTLLDSLSFSEGDK